jgi:cryptochrome
VLFSALLFTNLQGGERQALLRLEDYLADSKWVCSFEKPKTDPSAFVRPATTVLSPYLKFGCLSPRLFHQRLMAVYRGAKGVHSKPPVSLRGQLLWREFFYTVRCCSTLLIL